MKIDHIGIATRQLDEGLALWRDALGLSVDATEEISEQGVRVAMLPIGDTHVELLDDLSTDSSVGKFISRRGPVMHHMAVQFDEINVSLADLKSKGSRFIYETPRIGAGGCLIAF